MTGRLRRILRDLATDVGLFLFYPRCPRCRERTSHIEAHYRIEHAGDEW